jgi:hypothetical protein
MKNIFRAFCGKTSCACSTVPVFAPYCDKNRVFLYLSYNSFSTVCFLCSLIFFQIFTEKYKTINFSLPHPQLSLSRRLRKGTVSKRELRMGLNNPFALSTLIMFSKNIINVIYLKIIVKILLFALSGKIPAELKIFSNINNKSLLCIKLSHYIICNSSVKVLTIQLTNPFLFNFNKL